MLCKTYDDLELYYKVKGNLNAPETIVFLNGLTQSTDSWILMEPFFKEKYKIILMDFIFQGQSDKKGDWRDFNQHARDVKTLLEHENITKAHLIGISYSTFAHKTPYYEAIELSWWRALEMGGYSLMLDIMLPNVLSESYFSNPLVPIDKLKAARNDLSLKPEAIFQLMKATKERKDFRKQLHKVKAETLVIQGEQDTLFPVHLAKEVQENIKNAKLAVIKNAGHTLNLEHVVEVSATIKTFLN
jgi:3-oxoadipate enol-lactonase